MCYAGSSTTTTNERIEMGYEISDVYIHKKWGADEFTIRLVIDDAFICEVSKGIVTIPSSDQSWWRSEVAQDIAAENLTVYKVLKDYVIPTKYEEVIKWADSLPNVAGTGAS